MTTSRAVSCALGCVLVIVASGCSDAMQSPNAIDGHLDLTTWDFDADGDVALLGTWEICWRKLLGPREDCPSSWQPVPVRGLWSEKTTGSPMGGKGVATYRLRIALPDTEQQLSLAAGGVHTAYRLFVDGVESGGGGIVGLSADTTKTGVHQRLYALSTRSGETELLVQVANFVFRGGGLKRIWYLGRPESVQRGFGLAIVREGTLFSVGVIVGMVYLLLFALGPSEQSRGYFGLASLALGLRAVPASISGFGDLLVPWASFELLTRCEYLATALALFAGAGYARTKVAGVVPASASRIVQLMALAVGVIVVFAPYPLVLGTNLFQYVLGISVAAMLVVGYGVASFRGVPGVRVTAIAASIYILVLAHDLVRQIEANLGAPIELYPYAMVLWIMVEATELMQRFYETFTKVESLSNELTEANFELQEAEAAIVRFVPFGFLRALGKSSIYDVRSGDRATSQMSVLHCTFSMTPGDARSAESETTFTFAQRFAERIEPLIRHRRGFMNEFHGDHFQVLFGEGSESAVSAGLQIVAELRRFRASMNSQRQPSIQLGLCIDTGAVLLGTAGTHHHLLRSVSGEAVDTARQMESLLTGTRDTLLISEATRSGLDESSQSSAHFVATLATPVGEIEVYEIEVVEPPNHASPTHA